MTPAPKNGIRIEEIDRKGLPLLLEMIMELAEYEKLTHQVKADEESMARWLLGENPKARGLLLFLDDRPAGYCIYFYTFSTFGGRPGIYVEDVYIKPGYRRHGLGRAVFVKLARQARAEGCGRLEFAVLDWNEPALRFYESMGAQPLSEWLLHRFEGESLDRLAEAE